MTIPKFADFLRPVLALVAEAKSIEAPRRVLPEKIGQQFNLSEAEMNIRLASGITTVRSRCGWALTYLGQAGLINFPHRGLVTIMPEGKNFLLKYPENITPKNLATLPLFKAFLERSSNDIIEKSKSEQHQSPDEQINQALIEINESLKQELVKILEKIEPHFFEQLVLDLLGTMNYHGNLGHIEHTGRSGDQGIDGIVYADRLGLEKIYVQAKRWKNSIGSQEVQAFYGALAGQFAQKGIMITTSYFTESAKKYANSISNSLILIDGKKLIELMIEFQVGVSHKKMLPIPALDRDYFDE